MLDMAKPKNRVPYGLECVEEMLQESRLSRWTFYRYSQSISQRSSLSWITTRNRMDRKKVKRVGWTCTRTPYISSHPRGRAKIPRTIVSYHETKQAKMGLCNLDLTLEPLCRWKSSTPRIRRTNWRDFFSRIIPEMASFFKHIVVGQVWMELGKWAHNFWIDQNFFPWRSMAIHRNSQVV